MIRIIDGRGTGKTSRLLLLAKEYDALFVCANPEAMEVKANAYGINGIKFIDYYRFLRDGDIENNNIVIDELEQLVQYCLLGSQHLIGYTLSDND